MKEKGVAQPVSHSSLTAPQIALRKSLSSEEGDAYSTEVLVPPGGRIGSEEDFEKSDILLDDGTRLFIRHPRTGKWIEIQTGASSPRLAGVVMQTFGPNEDGRVRIYGNSYPDKDPEGNPIEPVYDIIVCDELAGVQNEHPEKIVRGTVLRDIRGPYTRLKSPPPEDEEEDKTEQFYVAVNTEGVYTGIIPDDLTGPDAESTIVISEIPIAGESQQNLELHTMTVHSYYLGEYQKIEAETGVMVYRQQTKDGLRLVVVKSRSVITDTGT